MTLKRQADGSTLYRGHPITTNKAVKADKLGRYVAIGRPFSQLAHAKAAIDEFEVQQ